LHRWNESSSGSKLWYVDFWWVSRLAHKGSWQSSLMVKDWIDLDKVRFLKARLRQHWRKVICTTIWRFFQSLKCFLVSSSSIVLVWRLWFFFNFWPRCWEVEGDNLWLCLFYEARFGVLVRKEPWYMWKFGWFLSYEILIYLYFLVLYK